MTIPQYGKMKQQHLNSVIHLLIPIQVPLVLIQTPSQKIVLKVKE